MDKTIAQTDADTLDFDVWGCRGSRTLHPTRSRLGVSTSCYSVLYRDELVVFDGGRGLIALGCAMQEQSRFARTRRIHLLISHSHMDHWEGLKDVEWFWGSSNGLDLRIYAHPNALTAIRGCFESPTYVPLEVLAGGTLASFEMIPIEANEDRLMGPLRLHTFSLNHYSGGGETRCPIDTLGFGVQAEHGPRLAYLCDHEPTAATLPVEEQEVSASQIAIYDAHFLRLREHRFGHGSIEHAALMARRFPETLVVGTHHSPGNDDEAILRTYDSMGQGLTNLLPAREATGLTWRAGEGGRGSWSPR